MPPLKLTPGEGVWVDRLKIENFPQTYGAPALAARSRSWVRASRRSTSDWMRPASAAKASRTAWISSSCVPTPER
jgi:hypothetical protein